MNVILSLIFAVSNMIRKVFIVLYDDTSKRKRYLFIDNIIMRLLAGLTIDGRNLNTTKRESVYLQIISSDDRTSRKRVLYVRSK